MIKFCKFNIETRKSGVKYLLVICIDTEVCKIRCETGKAAFTVGSPTQTFSLGVHCVQAVDGLLKASTLNLEVKVLGLNIRIVNVKTDKIRCVNVRTANVIRVNTRTANIRTDDIRTAIRRKQVKT